MNWKIGKKIIAIKDHSQGVFKKDDIFTLIAITHSKCKCNVLYLDIGFSSEKQGGCYLCQTPFESNLNIWWFWSTMFVPVDEQFAKGVLEEVTKQIKEKEYA